MMDEGVVMLHETDTIYFFSSHDAHDKDAPTKFGARQTPSFVRILCTVFVSGFTHAASRVSRVMNPGWMVSNIFFFGFSWDSGCESEDVCTKGVSKVLSEGKGRGHTLETVKVDPFADFCAGWRLDELDARIFPVFMCCL